MALPELQNDSGETVAIMLAAEEMSIAMDKSYSVLSTMLQVFKTIEYSMNQILMGALDTIIDQNSTMIEYSTNQILTGALDTIIDQNSTMIELLSSVSEASNKKSKDEDEDKDEDKDEDEDEDDDASMRFADEEDKIEGDREEGGIMSKMFAMFKNNEDESGGGGGGKMMSGAMGKLGGIGGSLIGLLVTGSLLAFLYFLPEFLDSKLFKEMKILVEEKIIPLFKMLYEDVLKPIGTYLYDGLLAFMEDLNDPGKGLWSIISENAGFLLTAVGGILIAKAPGLVLMLASSLISGTTGIIKKLGLIPSIMGGVTKVLSRLVTAFKVFRTFMMATFIPAMIGAFSTMMATLSPILVAAAPFIAIGVAIGVVLFGLFKLLEHLRDSLGFESIFDVLMLGVAYIQDAFAILANLYIDFGNMIMKVAGKLAKWFGLEEVELPQFERLSTDNAKRSKEEAQARKQAADEEEAAKKKVEEEKTDTALLKESQFESPSETDTGFELPVTSQTMGAPGPAAWMEKAFEQDGAHQTRTQAYQKEVLTRMAPAKDAAQDEALARMETETPATGELLDKGSAANAAAGMQVIISSPTTTIVDASVNSKQQSTNVTQSAVNARSVEPTVAQMVGAF